MNQSEFDNLLQTAHERDLTDGELARLERWLSEMHDYFIDHVKSRRGTRIADDPDLFTGEIWIGQKAVEKGLADGIGHLVPKMKEYFGDKVNLAVYGPKRRLLSRFGAQVIDDAISGLDERAHYARFGL